MLKIENRKVVGVRESFILNWYVMLTKIFFARCCKFNLEVFNKLGQWALNTGTTKKLEKIIPSKCLSFVNAMAYPL